MPKPKVATCLWVNHDAEDMADFYVSVVDDSSVDNVMRKDDGTALVVELQLAGMPVQLLAGGDMFKLDEAASIVVHTDSQDETDALWGKLTADGGQESMCGWCKDKFGVSWQVVPRALHGLFGADDKAAAGRAMAAMMQMKKIDIDALQRAFDDDGA